MLAPLTRAEIEIYMMNRRRRAVLVLIAATVIASVGSHLVVSCLRMGGPAAFRHWEIFRKSSGFFGGVFHRVLWNCLGPSCRRPGNGNQGLGGRRRYSHRI